MKEKSPLPALTASQKDNLKLAAEIAALQKKANAAKKEAQAAKAECKLARKRFKDARRTAKELKKAVKALKVEFAAATKKRRFVLPPVPRPARPVPVSAGKLVESPAAQIEPAPAAPAPAPSPSASPTAGNG